MARAEEGHIMGKKTRSRNTATMEKASVLIEKPIVRELPPIVPVDDELEANRRRHDAKPVMPADAPAASAPGIVPMDAGSTSGNGPETPPPAPAVPSTGPSAVRQPPAPPLLFEIGWEVCWQLGGIYTVLRSKAEDMIATWGDRYFLIGP